MKTGRPVETDVADQGAHRREGDGMAVDPRRQELGADVVRPAERTGLRQHAEFRRPLQGGPGGLQGRRMVRRHGSERSLGMAAGTARLPQGHRSDDRQGQMGKRRATFRDFPACCRPPAASFSPGSCTGEFEAFDAETGKKLWQFQDRLRHRRPADHLAAGRRAIRRGGERHRRRLLAVLRRRAAGFSPAPADRSGCLLWLRSETTDEVASPRPRPIVATRQWR